MSLIKKCDCDYEHCKSSDHKANVHVDRKCIHRYGISHEFAGNV